MDSSDAKIEGMESFPAAMLEQLLELAFSEYNGSLRCESFKVKSPQGGGVRTVLHDLGRVVELKVPENAGHPSSMVHLQLRAMGESEVFNGYDVYEAVNVRKREQRSGEREFLVVPHDPRELEAEVISFG